MQAESQDSERIKHDPEPVFIVGMNGSGTTMVLDCLNNHPDFYGFPIETKVLPMFIRRLDRYGDLEVDENFLRLWNDVRKIVFFRWVNGRRTLPLPADWASHERSLAAILDTIFTNFARREGKTRWCEKSPMYALHMASFAEMYPRARFIHMIRDGRDCANSFRRRYGFTPEKTMIRWRHVVRHARDAAGHLGSRYLEVRYEDLTAAPDLNMRKICAFLGAPFSPEVLRLSRERRDNKMVAQEIVPNSNRWRDSLNPRTAHRLELIGGRLLHELGYETSLPSSEWTPPRVLQTYWRRRDNVKSVVREIRRISQGESWRHRRVLVEKLFTHVRNASSAGSQ